MKKVILLCLLLTGCSFSREDIDTLKEACKPAEANRFDGSDDTVYCSDGTHMHLHEAKARVEWRKTHDDSKSH